MTHITPLILLEVTKHALHTSNSAIYVGKARNSIYLNSAEIHNIKEFNITGYIHYVMCVLENF